MTTMTEPDEGVRIHEVTDERGKVIERIPYRWVDINGYMFRRRLDDGEWLEVLTPHHTLRGRQFMCGVCNSSPCVDACPVQWKPDRLEWKASRARMSVEQWLAAHPDWLTRYAKHPAAVEYNRQASCELQKYPAEEAE